MRADDPDRFSFQINLGRVLAARRAVDRGRKTAVRVPIGDSTYDIPTFSIKADGTHITWVGRSMTADHMQIFAVLSGCLQRDRSLSLNGNIVYGEQHWRLFSSGRSFLLQRVPQHQLLPPPISYPQTPESHDHSVLQELQQPRAPIARPASASRSRTGRRLLELRSFSGPVQGPFRMLRMLVVFDQNRCTADERTLTSTMESMFRVVFGHNMRMNNFEMVYTCQKFTSRLLARNDFASAARTQLMNVRRRFGGDIMIVVGNYSFTNWWSASGDLGPSPTAVTTTTRESASMLHVIPHEVGHNWGFDHDRFSSWSNQGTYYCNTDARRCNFGWLNSTYMTIMSYGTDQGR